MKKNGQLRSVRRPENEEEKLACRDRPDVSHYVIVKGVYSDDWFRVGLVEPNVVYASHTKAPVIQKFDTEQLECVGVSQKTGRPCWLAAKGSL